MSAVCVLEKMKDKVRLRPVLLLPTFTKLRTGCAVRGTGLKVSFYHFGTRYFQVRLTVFIRTFPRSTSSLRYFWKPNLNPSMMRSFTPRLLYMLLLVQTVENCWTWLRDEWLNVRALEPNTTTVLNRSTVITVPETQSNTSSAFPGTQSDLSSIFSGTQSDLSFIFTGTQSAQKSQNNVKLPAKLISHSGGQLDNRHRGKIPILLLSWSNF